MNEIPNNIKPLNGTRVYIIGPNRLLNELIAGCLERETGARCLIGDDISQLPLSDYERDGNPARLVLLDSHGTRPEHLLAELKTVNSIDLSRHQVVLFNVSTDLGIEEECVWEGVHGFFYRNDPMDRFVTGVRAVLNGELWLSRVTMTKCIMQSRSAMKYSKVGARILTPRENEIMTLLAAGATNEEIADKLCVSLNTVKTHVYNTFRKIGVQTRVKAALWAARNL
jgi:DNA-binding NarL/FixJ family response regulator